MKVYRIVVSLSQDLSCSRMMQPAQLEQSIQIVTSLVLLKITKHVQLRMCKEKGGARSF